MGYFESVTRRPGAHAPPPAPAIFQVVKEPWVGVTDTALLRGG